MKSINELTPQELRTVADLRDQINAIVNGEVKYADTPSEALSLALSGVRTKRRYHRRKTHWTQTPRGREIMRKSMLRRHAQGTI